MKLTFALLSTAIGIGVLALAKPTFGATQGYYSKCSFIDKGADSGGDVLEMPCYIIEGANMNGGFFHILWRDGTRTIMSVNLQTGESIGSFKPLVYRGLYENPEGDLIYIGELELTDDRYNITEEGLIDRIF